MFAARLLTGVMRRVGRFDLTSYSAGVLPAPTTDVARSLYVHVPFCRHLCPYCSFNRFVYHEDRARAYFAALRREIEMAAQLGYDFHSLYVGGGTPTIAVDELARTIDFATDRFSITDVSTETNPNHLNPGVMEVLEGRVNRLSVGVQSFDDRLLAQIGRLDMYGSGADNLRYIHNAIGRFETLNIDLIFNFPAQTPSMLRSDVALAAASGANQLTFYPLMVSPVVEDALADAVGVVTYDREPDYYHQIDDMLNGRFTPVSAWTYNEGESALLDEYIVDDLEYVGLGAGSFSYLDGSLYVNAFSLKDYGARIESGCMGVMAWQPLARHDQMRYAFMTALHGLRLEKAAFKRQFGVSVERGLWQEMAFMRGAGAFSVDTPEELRLTPHGRYLVVVMMREFFIKANDLRDQARHGLTPEGVR